MKRFGDRAVVGMVMVFVVGAMSCSSDTPSSSATLPTTTSASPSTSEPGLYAVDVDAGDATMVLALPEGATEFAVNPAADIAYQANDEEGRPQIFVIKAGQTSPNQLTQEKLAARSPAWSPDGTRIAYRGLALDSTYEIYVVDVASGDAERVTHERRDAASDYPSPPSWLPDGEAIVFQVGEPPVVRRVDLATGATTTIVNDAGIPDVSPDGSQIAFNTWSVVKVTLVGMDGSNRTMIPSANDECCARWSPGGDRIAFIDYPAGQVVVYEVATGEKSVVGSGAVVDWLDDQTLLINM